MLIHTPGIRIHMVNFYHMKLLIWIGITVGGTIGGWAGAAMEHGNWMGGWSILLGAIGSLLGLWLAYKIGQGY